MPSKDKFQGLIRIDNGWYVAPIDDPEGQRLARLYSYGILDTPPEAAFDRISALAAALLSTPIALVNLLDTHRQWFKSCYGMDGTRETPLDHAFCTHALQSDHAVMVVGDASRDARFYNSPLVKNWPHIRFYAGAPITTQDGYKLGSLCVIDRVPRDDLSGTQKEHLAALADITMDQIELSLMNRKAGKHIKRLQKETPRSSGYHQRPPAGQGQGRAANLLVAGVDDQFATMLQSLGCVYEYCDTPAGALDIMAARGDTIDAVILGDNGQADHVCRIVRQLCTVENRRYRGVPVIGLSPCLDRDMFERCIQAGMNDVLQTPLTAESLKNCLREYSGAGVFSDIADERT